MISLLAGMIATRKLFLAYEITNVPAIFVQRILFDSFLPLPLDPRERCEWTTVPLALVLTATAQRRTGPITDDFRVFPALVTVTVYVLGGGPAPARTDYLYPTGRTRPSVARGRTSVRAVVKLP